MKPLSTLFLVLVPFGACGEGDAATDTSTATDATTATETTTTTTDAATTETAATETVETETTATDTTAAETEVVEDVVTWTPVTYTYPTCGAATADLAGCVDPAKLEATLGAIAGSRFPGEPKWQAAQDLCKTTLTDLGFTVTLQPTLLGANVIGVKTGATKPDEQVIVGAHYDGVRGCDAADDNGSGVAGALEVARVLASDTHARTLVVVCWDVEELGLVGSRVHAASIDPAKVIAVYNFEMIGYTNDAPGSQTLPLGFELLFPAAGAELAALGHRGVFITLVAGDDAAGPVQALTGAAEAIGLPAIAVILERALIGNTALGDLHRSDHAPFWGRGVPAIQLTDSANFRNPNYHCPSGNSDTVASLDLAFMRAVVAATAVAAKTTLDAADPGTTPMAREPECDVVAQDCAPGKRCGYVVDTATNLSVRRCIDVAANPVGAGEACTRTAAGEDDCAAGTTCTFYGGTRTNTDLESPTFARICSPLCTTSAECAEDAVCIGIGSSFFEQTGICRPRCADAFGGSCGEGRKCEPAARVEGWGISDLVCRPSGTVAAGGVCVGSSDCPAGHACSFEADARRCRPYCDAGNACPEGLSCGAPYVTADPGSTLGLCRGQ